jgi:hypothetical protein
MPASASEQEVLAAAKRLIATLVPRPTPQPPTAAPTINFQPQPRRSADRSRRKQWAEREDLAKAKDIIVRLRSKTLSDRERHELLTSLVSLEETVGHRFSVRERHDVERWRRRFPSLHNSATPAETGSGATELLPRLGEGDRRGDQQGCA